MNFLNAFFCKNKSMQKTSENALTKSKMLKKSRLTKPGSHTNLSLLGTSKVQINLGYWNMTRFPSINECFPLIFFNMNFCVIRSPFKYCPQNISHKTEPPTPWFTLLYSKRFRGKISLSRKIFAVPIFKVNCHKNMEPFTC